MDNNEPCIDKDCKPMGFLEPPTIGEIHKKLDHLFETGVTISYERLIAVIKKEVFLIVDDLYFVLQEKNDVISKLNDPVENLKTIIETMAEQDKVKRQLAELRAKLEHLTNY